MSGIVKLEPGRFRLSKESSDGLLAAASGTEIGRFRKSATEEVIVSVETFHGREVVNARVWWTNPETGEILPSRKGLTITTDKLPALLNLLTRAMVAVSPTWSAP